MHQKAKYNNISSVEKVKCELKQEKENTFLHTHNSVRLVRFVKSKIARYH